MLGRDGLLIDSQAVARPRRRRTSRRAFPAIIGPADELGAARRRGELLTAVLEHRDGLAIVSVLSAEALLLVLVTPHANIGQLLFELRRNREHIAALV